MRTSDYFSTEFKDILEGHVADFKSEKSKSVYLSKVADICDYCRKDFTELSKSDIQSYFDSVKKRSRNSKSVWLHILRSVAASVDAEKGTCLKERFTLDEDLTPDVYVDPGKIPGLDKVDALLTHIRDSGDDQLFAILTVMLETGITIKELLSIQKDNVAVDTGGFVYLKFDPKTEDGITRYVPLSNKTAVMLQELGSKREHNPEEAHIFLNSYGEPMSLRLIEKQLKDACDKAGTGPVRLRELKDIARAGMLKGGASHSSLAYQTGASKNWFFRLGHLVNGFDHSASSYNILKVDKNGSKQQEEK